MSKDKYAHLAKQSRRRKAQLRQAAEEARANGETPRPTKLSSSSCGAPLPTCQEWVRPGSDFDKLRKKQETRVAEVARKQYEQRLLFQHRKRRQAQAEQQAQEQAEWFQKEQDRQWDAACARHRERQQQSFDRMLEDAAEELAIEDAREEIRRNRR